MWKSILAIAVGAAFGALLRWQLGIRLNAFFPTIPPGTLVANLIGAYVIGPDRCLRDRSGDCFLRLFLGLLPGMASAGDYRILRRVDHFLDFFRRTGNTAAAGACLVGSRYCRGACRGLGSHDYCRHGHHRLGKDLDLMLPHRAGRSDATKRVQGQGDKHGRRIFEILRQ